MTLLELIRQYGEQMHSEGYHEVDQSDDLDSEKTFNEIEAIFETFDDKVQSQQLIEISYHPPHYSAAYFIMDSDQQAAQAQGKTFIDSLINLSEKIKELP